MTFLLQNLLVVNDSGPMKRVAARCVRVADDYASGSKNGFAAGRVKKGAAVGRALDGEPLDSQARAVIGRDEAHFPPAWRGSPRQGGLAGASRNQPKRG